MFNVFQVLRTLMGIVQMNAFVASWKDAIGSVRVLSGRDEDDSKNERDSSFETGVQGVGTSAESSERSTGLVSRRSSGLLKLKIFAEWCKRVMGSLRDYKRESTEKSEYNNSRDDEQTVPSWGTCSNNVNYEDNDDDMEEMVKVNNIVVDNELGGREVTVLPSMKKMLQGLREGSFKPSKWLKTDRVMLNTVRWSGAFLCGVGEHWSLGKYVLREDGETLEKFFSAEMNKMRRILQYVEWNGSAVEGGRDFFGIRLLEADGEAKLTGESTAYGTDFDWYVVSELHNVEL